MSDTPHPSDWRQAWDWSFGLIEDLRLAWRLLQDERVPWAVKVVPIAAIVYVVSPIDFIPDFLLGLGQLDDLAILLLGLKAFISLSPQPVVDQYLRDIKKGGPPRADSGVDETDYITAEYRVLDDDEKGRAEARDG
jgi:uncharacterized membrane protein YkvA (DUF1232 family)